MPKLPRNLSGRKLAQLIKKVYGYEITRETGSHIRLVSAYKGSQHHLTIPDHMELRIGTLNNILNDIGSYLEITKDVLAERLFS